MAKSLDIIDPKRDLDNDPHDEGRVEKEDRVIEASRHEESSGSGLFYLIIGIIAVIVSASLALYILFKDDKANSGAKTASASATATVELSPTITPSVASSSAAITQSPAAGVSTTSTFKYTSEQIRIANGNSTSGEAARIKAELEAKGYKIASVGNATKSYTDSIVYYKTGQEKLAAGLKADLASEYVATVEKSDEIVGSYDAVIVLGAK